MLIHAYDIGHAESSFYGPYKTDAKGNFGFTEDIKRYHVEKFGYRITNPEIHPNLSTETEAYSNGDFQTINFLSYAGINFHIKNTTPLNGADLFVSYTTAFDTNSNQETIYKNFSGINVDVSQYVYPFGTHNSLLYYKYQYRKANVYYTTPFDTIRLIGEDTVVANIFY